MFSIRTFLAAGALGAAALALAWQAAPKLPPPFHTPSANNGPRVIARPDGARLQVPAGFNIDVFAEGFEVPRFMLRGPSGEILLSDSSRQNGAVWVLLDTKKTFKADSRKKLIEGLDRPYGLAFW